MEDLTAGTVDLRSPDGSHPVKCCIEDLSKVVEIYGNLEDKTHIIQESPNCSSKLPHGDVSRVTQQFSDIGLPTMSGIHPRLQTRRMWGRTAD